MPQVAMGKCGKCGERGEGVIRDVAKKNKRENVGIFPKSGTPPLPPVWEFFNDFNVYFWEVSHVKNSKNMEVGFG